MASTHTELIMQMWSSCQSGFAYIPDRLTLFYSGPSTQFLRMPMHVCVQGGVFTASMANDYGFSVAAFATKKLDTPGACRFDWCANRSCVIDTAVGPYFMEHWVLTPQVEA